MLKDSQMSNNLPYAQAAGTLEKMLDKIKTASVPEKFSSDFVSTKLMMKGGAGRAIIPFIKKMGFVSTDGTPTNFLHVELLLLTDLEIQLQVWFY